ncbi:MAG: trypsin-like peptidase domain-containing protein [bacterium]
MTEKAPGKELYKPVIEYEEAVTTAVEQSASSVVSIVISKDLQIMEQCPSSPFAGLPPEIQQFFGMNFDVPSQCPISTEKREIGGGSGFIVSDDGLIVTNKHVVSTEDAEYTVIMSNGNKYDAKVLDRDPIQDIALMKIEAMGLPAARIGDSDTIKLGQTAIAIGNSLNEFQNSVSVGVISGLSRTVSASGETISGVLQTDAAINPGNSGGPLLNLKGEVIGINTAIVVGAQNIGFAIPINDAIRDIQSVRETGEIKVAFLGVRYLVVTEDLATKEKLSVQEGALLRGEEDGPAIVLDSPAAKAGLQAEDIITAVNGKAVTLDTPLNVLIGREKVGDIIVLDVYRKGEKRTFSITLEERPKL